MSSMYISKSMIAAARGQSSLLSSACCRTTYWARYGAARSPNISLIASYTSGGLVRSSPFHWKRWYRLSFCAIMTWENICVRSATKATGFLLRKVESVFSTLSVAVQRWFMEWPLHIVHQCNVLSPPLFAQQAILLVSKAFTDLRCPSHLHPTSSASAHQLALLE